MRPLRPIFTSLFLLLFLPALLPAQENLERLSKEFDRRWRVERAEAESLAVRLNLPIRSISPDGTVRELKRLRDGMPVYLKTDNVTAGKTISSDKVYPGGGAGLNLTGSGVTLGEWDEGGIRTTLGTSVNLSESGVLIQAQALDLGSDLGFAFRLPGATEPVRGRARVVRLGGDACCGLEFSEISGESLQVIRAFVTRTAF